jgi:hypothetical protein
MQLLFQVDMSLVVIRFHWSLFERAVHPFPLALGPGMVGFGQPMVDTMLLTDTIKAMVKGVAVAFTVRELHAMIGEHRVDLLGHSRHHVPEELSGHQCVGFGVQLGLSKLAGAGDRDNEGELAFFRAALCNVDVEVADRLGLKPLLFRLLAGHIR